MQPMIQPHQIAGATQEYVISADKRLFVCADDAKQRDDKIK
jgi:hypothetical protein